jgi:hypothetical protein
MAKRKTKKVEKPSKITNEELNKVQGVINEINRAQIEIGSMESRKHNVLHHIAGLNEQLTIIQSEFQEEYGTSDINIQDGTINYQKEDVKTD